MDRPKRKPWGQLTREEQLARQREDAAARYQRKKLDGECKRCPNDIIEDSLLCAVCLPIERARKRQVAAKAWAVKASKAAPKEKKLRATTAVYGPREEPRKKSCVWPPRAKKEI